MDRNRIELHLRCRVQSGRRTEFFAFLKDAIPFYVAPGGIAVHLLEDSCDDHRFIEVVLYDDEAAYTRDQERVKNDPKMRAYLAQWRELLAEPPIVEVYRRVAP